MSNFEDALRLHQQGQIEEALSIYLEILKNHPEDADSQHLLGVCHLQLGQFLTAQTEIKKAIQLNHQVADFWINYSQAFKLSGDTESALFHLQTALNLDPSHTEGWNNLGNLQQQLEQHQEAVNSYSKALSQQPNYANAHYNISISLSKLANLTSALEHCKTALQLEPKNVEYWGQFSHYLITSGHKKQAKSILMQALELHQNNHQLNCELASLLADEGELNAALKIYQTVIQQQPDNALALSQILYLKRSICDWEDLDDLSGRLLDAIKQQQPYISPFSFLTEPSSPEQQLECAKLWAKQFTSWHHHLNKQPTGSATTVEKNINQEKPKKIVIGYVSADYYQHPTAYLAAKLFEQHDRRKFRVIAYSNSRDDNSEIATRIKNGFDLFVDIKTMSMPQVLQKISDDGVDILIDLKGYTMEAASEIFANRAAPIQVNYLGYPGTMGAKFIDYIIGDDYVTPLRNQKHFSEKIVQLNCCYQINDNQRPLPTNSKSKQDLGLPEDKFIFACFNNSWKITPVTFQTWMEILKQCPNSILWLMDRHPKSNFKENILNYASQAGIDSKRIIFTKPAAYEDYLSLYLLVDLFLETVPYNAHTMASDALWMGCPVLSVAGETFSAKVGESILNSVGLKDELFCADLDAFIQRAKVLYLSPNKIDQLKKYLNTNRQKLSLFDSEQTVKAIEAAYVKMMAIYTKGKKPQHITI